MATIKVYKTKVHLAGIEIPEEQALHTGIEFEFNGKIYHVRGGTANLSDSFRTDVDNRLEYEVWHGEANNHLAPSPDVTDILGYIGGNNDNIWATGTDEQIEDLYNLAVQQANNINNQHYAYLTTHNNCNAATSNILNHIYNNLTPQLRTELNFTSPENVPTGYDATAIGWGTGFITNQEFIDNFLSTHNNPFPSLEEAADFFAPFFIKEGIDIRQRLRDERHVVLPTDNDLQTAGPGGPPLHVGIANSIADTLNMGINGATLLRLNSVFTDASFTVGGLVHIPVSASNIDQGTSQYGLPTLMDIGPLSNGHTYVFDAATEKLYTMSTNLDGSNSGHLIIQKQGTQPYQAETVFTLTGQYNSLGYADGVVSIGLTNTAGNTYGALMIDTSTGTAKVRLAHSNTFADPVIEIPVSLSSATLTIPATTGGMDTILTYLDQLGSPITLADIDLDRLNTLFPTAPSHTITGNPESTVTNLYGETGVAVRFTPGSTPNSTMTGHNTVTLETPEGPQTRNAINIVNVYGIRDLSHSTINNIDILEGYGSVSINQSNFNNFTSLGTSMNGVLTLQATEGGTYSLLSKDYALGTINLEAMSWSNTVLIGNANTTILRASEYGNDTLVAGDGAGATLYGGFGNNTLTGGTGDDTFEVSHMGTSSIIEGGAGTDTLHLKGSIETMAVTDIENLDFEGDVKMTANQFNGFTAIETEDGNTITLTTGGTITLADKTTNAINIEIRTSQSTTVYGNDADNVSISAYGDGNYTLVAGDGENTHLSADGDGNVTLTGGSNGTWFSAFSPNATGNYTLNGGTGDDLFSVSDLSSSSSISGGSGTDTLYASGDLSQVSLSSLEVLGNSDVYLNSTQLSMFTTLSGDGTIYATNAGTYSLSGKTIESGFFTLSAIATDEAVTLVANDAGSTLVAGSNSTLQGSIGDDIFDLSYAGNLGTITGGGGYDSISFSNNYLADLTSYTFSNVTALLTANVANINLTTAQLDEFEVIEADGDEALHLRANGAGTYTLSGKNVYGAVSLDASGTTDAITLVANENGSTLIAGTGDATLTGGAGDDTFNLAFGTTGTITGNGGNDTIYADNTDLTQFSINGVSTLEVGGSNRVKLTTAQLSSFTTLHSEDNFIILEAAEADTYDLTGISTSSQIILDATTINGGVTLTSTNHNATLISGASNDAFITGDGIDIIQYDGNFADYSLNFLFSNFLRITDNRTGAPNGIDIATNKLDILRFADREVNVSPLLRPVPRLVVAENTTVSGKYNLPTGYTISLINAPTEGTFSLNSDGSFTYTAPTSFTGTVSFQYNVTSPEGLTRNRTSNIQINPGSTPSTYTPEAEQAIAGLAISNSFDAIVYRQERTEIVSLTGGGYVQMSTLVMPGIYNGTYYQVFDATGQLIVTDFPGNSLTHTMAGVSGTALTDGGFALTWLDDNNNGMMWRRFDANGVAQTSEILVNSQPSEGGSIVQLQDGNIAVIWSGDSGSGNLDIFMRLFDTTGTSLGNPITVNSSTGGSQALPHATVLANGNIAVIWWDFTGSYDGDQGIFLRIMDATGNPVTSEQILTSNISGSQHGPAITALADGGFVAAWNTPNVDGSSYAAVGQRFDATGTAVGSQFTINTYTTDDQYDPAITALSDGGFFAVWHSMGQDGSGLGIYGQRYAANGNPVGTEIQINTSTTSDQDQPSITELANGDLLATWRDFGTSEIKTRRFTYAPGNTEEPLTGSTNNDYMIGRTTADTLNGLTGHDTLQGGAGNDILIGGEGNDTYLITVGDGNDTIDNQDATGNDTINFGAGFNRQNLWFTQNGDNLQIDALNTGDAITLTNWYTNENQQVDIFQADGYTLDKLAIDQLVNAMAVFDPTTFGTITNLNDLPTSVATAITAHWQSA